TVVAEPVEGSRIGHFVSKIPLVRRFKKRQEAFVPPKVTHQVLPLLKAKTEASGGVDVKVYVTESGKGDFVELLSGESPRRRELHDAVIHAARRWEFTPARLGDEKAPGEVLLHFQFQPTTVAGVP